MQTRFETKEFCSFITSGLVVVEFLGLKNPWFLTEVVTYLSVIPCRLNGDLHEWFNEVVTVPSQNLPNSLSGEHAGVA